MSLGRKNIAYNKKACSSVIIFSPGNLEAVKKMLTAGGTAPVAVNVSEKWTETQQKWGHKKRWEWHDDTPLIAGMPDFSLKAQPY